MTIAFIFLVMVLNSNKNLSYSYESMTYNTTTENIFQCLKVHFPNRKMVYYLSW